VRAQAGVRVGTLARALAERGQELLLTPEMGNISVGALAVTTCPQPSHAVGLAQLSSLVTELKLITPQGKHMTVLERDRDLMRVLRSSFGLLGVVHEVVLRVQPLTPVKIDYHVLSLKDFTARFSSIVAAPGALRLHISPFDDRIIVERRTLDEGANITRSGIWQIRNSVMRNVLPAFGSTIGSVLSSPGLRSAWFPGCNARFAPRSTRLRREWSCMRTNGCANCRRNPGRRATRTVSGPFRRISFRKCSQPISPSAGRITERIAIAATS